MSATQEQLLAARVEKFLPPLLPAFLLNQRWFGGKAQQIRAVTIRETIPLPGLSQPAFIFLVEVHYGDGSAALYGLPLLRAAGEPTPSPPGVPTVHVPGEGSEEKLVFTDALWEKEFARFLLEAVADRRSFPGAQGEIRASRTEALERLWRRAEGPLPASLLRAEQSNTSVLYGDRLVLKFYRRLEQGINPDLEIGAFLTEKAGFPHIPPVAGYFEYHRPELSPMTVAILQGFVPNQGDAWRYTLECLGESFRRAPEPRREPPPNALPPKRVLELAREETPGVARDWIGPYLGSARLLGERTAELHRALASDPSDPNFAPEPFSPSHQQFLYQSMDKLAGEVFPLLRNRLPDLPEPRRSEAARVLAREGEVRQRFRSVHEHPLTAPRTRIHGDYHLGQVLYTGRDFVIIDFEGEPARPLSERRLKRSPLQDVAGMLRSFHYAAYTGLEQRGQEAGMGARELSSQEPWARLWTLWVRAAFLGAYLRVAGPASLLPADPEELERLLNAFLLEKAVYELGYELNNRPTWVWLPLQGIVELLEPTE